MAPEEPLELRRHGQTWGVGLEALPNETDGSICGTPLVGPWPAWDGPWHRAQVSDVYPGYPAQDELESDAAHRFRLKRDAAHVDGLLPIGPNRRRFLKEPHAFILGIALTAAQSSPLVVWPGSQVVMGRAFRACLEEVSPESWEDVDLTEAYSKARAHVFETCERVEVPLVPGEAVWLHRHLVHGVAPWRESAIEGPRRVAYFRPTLGRWSDWL